MMLSEALAGVLFDAALKSLNPAQQVMGSF